MLWMLCYAMDAYAMLWLASLIAVAVTRIVGDGAAGAPHGSDAPLELDGTERSVDSSGTDL